MRTLSIVLNHIELCTNLHTSELGAPLYIYRTDSLVPMLYTIERLQCIQADMFVVILLPCCTERCVLHLPLT